MNFLYVNYPSWIHPEIFPGVPFFGFLRWYGLMYIFAFGFAYKVLQKMYREGALEEEGFTTTEDDVINFIATGIFFLLVGARVFSTLVYDTTGIYRAKPWLIFWPFDSEGNFTGLAGMSYHGGFIGGFLGMVFWTWKHKRNFFKWCDTMAIAIPCGYTFGRLGNFLNGELYGRITTAPVGMVFPYAEKFSSSIQWVKDFAAEIGMQIPASGPVNLPRHPSQLYEAFFEGIFLFTIMFMLRKKRFFPGFFSAFYITGYGLVRFFIEYFRMPDADIGYRFSTSADAVIYKNTSLMNISTGQILCFLMIIFGLSLGTACFIKYKALSAKSIDK